MTKFFLLIIVVLTSCTEFTDKQRQELQKIQTEHPEDFIKVKDPETAAILGILPFGVANFYNDEVYLGLANMVGSLVWPISISWTIVGARDGAERANYDATTAYLNAKNNETLNTKDNEINKK